MLRFKINILLCLFILVGCRSAQDHLKLFYKKGGTIENKTKIVRITDTIPGADGKDSIIYRNVPCDCPEPQPPKTRWMVRFDNRRFSDSLKNLRKFYNDSVDAELNKLQTIIDGKNDSLNIERKRDKSEDRHERKMSNSNVFWSWIGRRWWLLLIIGFIIRHYLPKIWSRFFPKIPPDIDPRN